MALRVLIAGCGYVGCELGRRLLKQGHCVWGLRRAIERLPTGLRPLRADLLAPQTLEALPRDLDVVCYTAAAGAYDERGYEAAYVTGVRHLLDALQAQGQQPRRIFFTSSTGVYGQSDGGWVDETSETRPVRATAQAILRGEELLQRGPYPATVLRLSGIYGPGRSRLIRMLRQGRARRRGARDHWTNRVHRDDCAGALAYLMRIESPAQLYLVSDSEPVRSDDVMVWLARQMKLPIPEVEPTAEASRVRGRNKRCRNSRLLSSGFHFEYPTFREGFTALLGSQELG